MLSSATDRVCNEEEDNGVEIEGDHVNFCEAFPIEIPEEILTGEHDHKTHFEGDNGLLFDPVKEV